MRKIVDDIRLIYKCCSLYYEDNLGQDQIAEYLGISKSSVSRLLSAGRKSGIVEVTVHHASQFMYEDMAREIMKKYSLHDVIVAESSPLDSQEDRISKLHDRACGYLDLLLKDGDYVGVSLGSTLRNIAHSSLECRKRNCTFVPLVGGMGLDEAQSGNVAAAFAEKFGGKAIPFYSPALFSNEALMREFFKEDSVKHIFDYYAKLSTVISGFRYMHDSGLKNLTVEKMGFVTREDSEEYANKGAVANFVLRFIDKNGDTGPFDEFNRRVAGISLDQYRKVQNRIIVTDGTGKTDIIKACIEAGYANILIIDVDCARELLSSP